MSKNLIKKLLFFVNSKFYYIAGIGLICLLLNYSNTTDNWSFFWKRIFTIVNYLAFALLLLALVSISIFRRNNSTVHGVTIEDFIQAEIRNEQQRQEILRDIEKAKKRNINTLEIHGTNFNIQINFRQKIVRITDVYNSDKKGNTLVLSVFIALIAKAEPIQAVKTPLNNG